MKRLITFATACVVIIACQQIALAKERVHRELSELEKVIVFAVQPEAKANNLESKKDLCIGFGHGLKVNEKAILSQLKRNGLEVHSNRWCIRDWPRGFSISVLAPVKATASGTYELVMDAADLYIKPGEHVATLLRKGTYVIHYDENSGPQLVSYRQSCCGKEFSQPCTHAEPVNKETAPK